jgi:NAD(P) transhydrogenase subunit alpha
MERSVGEAPSLEGSVARRGSENEMRVAAARERRAGEQRVAIVPETVARIAGLGAQVAVEHGAGRAAGYLDDAYRDAGASVAGSPGELAPDVLLCVGPPPAEVLDAVRDGGFVVGLLGLATDDRILAELAKRRLGGVALELLPRTSRAQAMDVLSSQASLAGYKAVLVGANLLRRILPLQMTAAGTLTPAKVLVLGAGVAGLQAIATARRLGGRVEAFDVRRAAREEVESLGARFLEVPLDAAEGEGGYAAAQSEEYLARQRALLAERVADSDLVITTAQIPFRAAPRLVTGEMVKDMRPGSVIVDMAAETGGNVEGSRPGEIVEVGEVRIVGATNLAAELATHASQTLARNFSNLLAIMVEGGTVRLDDELVRACLVVEGGEVRWSRPA